MAHRSYCQLKLTILSNIKIEENLKPLRYYSHLDHINNHFNIVFKLCLKPYEGTKPDNQLSYTYNGSIYSTVHQL